MAARRRWPKAFFTTPWVIRQWVRWDKIPCTVHAGLYLGLLRRGYEPEPKLFDVRSLSEIAGL